MSKCSATRQLSSPPVLLPFVSAEFSPSKLAWHLSHRLQFSLVQAFLVPLLEFPVSLVALAV